MYIEKSTEDERLSIDYFMFETVQKVEFAYSLLSELLEKYFALIDNRNAKENIDLIGTRLHGIQDLLFDGLLEYHLAVGTDFLGVEPFMRSVENVQSIQRVKKAYNVIIEKGKRLTYEDRRKLEDSISGLTKLPDIEAVPLLEKLAGI